MYGPPQNVPPLVEFLAYYFVANLEGVTITVPSF